MANRGLIGEKKEGGRRMGWLEVAWPRVLCLSSVLLTSSQEFQLTSHELDTNEVLQDQFGFKPKSFSKNI